MTIDLEIESFNLGEITLNIQLFPNMVLPSEGYTKFLLNHLKAEGKIGLDLGCGTGILAIALAKLGFEKVYAVDLSENCITATQYNANLNGVSPNIIALKSNLFEAIPQDIRFDFIVANLPCTPSWDNIPLYSPAGKDSRGEAIDKMLDQAVYWLTPEGTLQFTHSSRISLEKTMQLMDKQGYEYTQPIRQTIPCKQSHYFELYPDYFQHLLKTQGVYVEQGTIFEWVYMIQARLKPV